MKKSIQLPQRDGLDGEEVDGEHALRLRPQELAPGKPGPLAGWTQARLAEELAHRGR
jgi:hypothetical protein